MKINFIKNLKIHLLVFLVLFPISFIFAQQSNTGLVPCTDDCGFYDLIKLINNVLGFVFKYILAPLAAVLFAWAGLQMIFSGGNESKKEQAKKIFSNVVIGVFIAGGAYLFVKLLLDILGYKGDSFLE